jgi:hypothetical protein
MTYIKVAIGVACIFAFSACLFRGETIQGNGNMTTESRDVGNVSKIKSSGSLDVVLIQGPSSILLEADENLLAYLVTKNEDGWLQVHWKDNVNIESTNTVKVTITMPMFKALGATGSGSIISDGKLTSDHNMEVKSSGSGSIQIAVNAPEITAQVTGSGNMQISGETRNVSVTVTGSGRYDGENLKAENAKAKVTGSGDALVFADETINAKITGSGSLNYAGRATVHSVITGSGTIKKIN